LPAANQQTNLETQQFSQKMKTKKRLLNKELAMCVLLFVCRIFKSFIISNNLNGAHHVRFSSSGGVVKKTFPDNSAKTLEKSYFTSIQNPAKLGQNRLMHIAGHFDPF